MKNSGRNIITILIITALFGIAIGHFEGVVVYYLRMAISQTPNILPLEPLPLHLLRIEQTREAATILMLVTFAFLIGKSKIEKLLIFFYTFAIWDIFYYVSLYLMLGWPTSLTTIDVLFLIPAREFWIVPVYVPIFISLITILVTTMLLVKRPKRLFKVK